MPMFNRRHLLQSTASGFGWLAFSALAHEQAARAAEKNPLAPKATHFPARAKRVIFLCMEGAPSHVDTFDHKPKLQTDTDKPYTKGRFSGAKLLGSQWAFKPRGKSGLPISDLFPELAKHADDLCLLNGMHTDLPNHAQAFLQMHCGIFQFPRPSLGAWSLYGLGTENANLPGFITLSPPSNNGGSANYGSSFLPAIYQGTKIGMNRFGGNGDAQVSNLKNPSRGPGTQRVQLDFLQSLNKNALDGGGDQAGIEGMIESYELAFRMQAELPKLLDTSKETRATQDLYGLTGPTAGFGRQCLLARKFVEAGVRFVEITSGGWDHHQNLSDALPARCTSIDKPIAGLLADLKQREMLKDTLVLWGGEFGRTPTAQNGNGRDHNAKGFSMWMAGGGVKGGLRHGSTDEYGFEAVSGKVHIHDWHATILHLLGLDHEKLTYNYAGREMKITDVKTGAVVKDIFA